MKKRFDGIMLDIIKPNNVEVIYDVKKQILWINVDDQCVLHCCQITSISMERFNGDRVFPNSQDSDK